MKRTYKTLVVTALVSAVSACSMLPSERAKELDSVEQPQSLASPSYAAQRNVQGTLFDKYLYDGYRSLAKKEDFEHDFENLAKFQERAERAGDGRLVSPEALDARLLPAHTIQELSDARTRLESAFYAGASVKHPRVAAEAQVKFDCWMEQQEEDIQQHDIDECKSAFWKAMAILEGSPAPVEPGLVATHAHDHDHLHSHPGSPDDMCHNHAHEKPVIEPTPEYVGPYIVYFDLDQFAITPKANDVLDVVIADAKRLNPARVVLFGHTDSSGSKAHNEALSSNRVNEVARVLNRAGVSTIIRASHYGENQLRINTGDGVRHEGNRRVEIDFEW